MRSWKILLIVAIVGAGFGTGYLWKSQKVHKPSRPFPAVVVQPEPMKFVEPESPGVDPSLILPPPSSVGVVIDPPVDVIRAHFLGKAGLGTTDLEPPQLDGTPPPSILPQPIFRLPAPQDETPVRRVQHREFGIWVYTNQRQLALNFDITRKCVGGIKAVELWGRRSAEAEYECVDRMEGDKPPFATRLWSEGNYEFRLGFENFLGEKSKPGRDAAADIYVCLDTTPPGVEMERPVFVSPGVIKLKWHAEDPNLEESPIRLEYCTDGEEWLSIVAGDGWLPNIGVYTWRLPEGLSDNVRFRVQARDKAGNIEISGSHRNPAGDHPFPEGRISGCLESLPPPRVADAEPFSIHPRIRLTTFDANLPGVLGVEGRPELLPMMPRIEEPELLPFPRVAGPL